MSLTRREALCAAVTAAGSLALSACAGTGAQSGAADTVAQTNDVQVTDDAVIEEYLERDGYTVGGHELLTSLKHKDEICRARDVQGRVETLEYQTHSYVYEEKDPSAEVVVNKTLNVWLPAGYDPAVPHDVLYLLHGTGQMQNYWLSDESTFGEKCHGSETRAILDGMVADALISNVIVVTPTYYSMPEADIPATVAEFFQDPLADRWPMLFHKELRETIIPLVESTYLTHAQKDVSDESLQASREHRAFAGLSRGSMTTVNSAMMRCADLFAYYGCFSGVWADFDEFKALFEGDYRDLAPLFWYNGNGTRDFSLENHQEFCLKALQQMPDTFQNGSNFAWVSFGAGDHNYESWSCDLYNALLCFFR